MRNYEELKAQGKIYGFLPKENIRAFDIKRIDKEIINKLKGLNEVTSELSDALDNLGYCSGMTLVPSTILAPLYAGCRAVGTALTQRSCPEKIYNIRERETRMAKMDAWDVPYLAEPGDIWVIDAKGCECSHFGVTAAKMHKEHGLVGTIVDGMIRHGESIRLVEYPFWSKGCTPYTGMKRIETIEINGTITLHNIQVNPGDLVAADGNGVCVVPREIVEDVFDYLCKKSIV